MTKQVRAIESLMITFAVADGDSDACCLKWLQQDSKAIDSEFLN